MSKKVRKTAVKKETVNRQYAKKKAVKKTAVKKAARKKKAAEKVKRKPAEPAPKRMPETILPPPEELVTEYEQLWDEGEAILQEMAEYDEEGFDEEDEHEDAHIYYEGDIEEWGRQRDAFFDRAEKVWLGLHPDTDPSWGDLDDWLGGNKLYMDLPGNYLS